MRLSRRKKKILKKYDAFIDRLYPDYLVETPDKRSKEDWLLEDVLLQFMRFRRTK